jgi:hypothetical protein
MEFSLFSVEIFVICLSRCTSMAMIVWQRAFGRHRIRTWTMELFWRQNVIDEVMSQLTGDVCMIAYSLFLVVVNTFITSTHAAAPSLSDAPANQCLISLAGIHKYQPVYAVRLQPRYAQYTTTAKAADIQPCMNGVRLLSDISIIISEGGNWIEQKQCRRERLEWQLFWALRSVINICKGVAGHREIIDYASWTATCHGYVGGTFPCFAHIARRLYSVDWWQMTDPWRGKEAYSTNEKRKSRLHSLLSLIIYLCRIMGRVAVRIWCACIGPPQVFSLHSTGRPPAPVRLYCEFPFLSNVFFPLFSL